MVWGPGGSVAICMVAMAELRRTFWAQSELLGPSPALLDRARAAGALASSSSDAGPLASGYFVK